MYARKRQIPRHAGEQILGGRALLGAATGGIKNLAGQLFDGKKGVDFGQVGKAALGGAAGSIPLVGGMLQNKIAGGGAQAQAPGQAGAAPGAGMGGGIGQGLMGLAQNALGMEAGGGIPHNPDLAGAPYKMRGVRLMKAGGINEYGAGGNIYANNGVTTPPIDDVKNIRLLQGEGGPQLFLSQGEGQYSPIGDMKALRSQLGDDRYGEYMASIGMNANRDDQGNIKGFAPAEGVKDPYARASAQFREEAFGDRSRQQALADEYFAENQGSQAVQQAANRVPAYKGRQDLQAMDVYRQMEPSTQSRLQSDFLLRTLSGGQGGGRGGQ